MVYSLFAQQASEHHEAPSWQPISQDTAPSSMPDLKVASSLPELSNQTHASSSCPWTHHQFLGAISSMLLLGSLGTLTLSGWPLISLTCYTRTSEPSLPVGTLTHPCPLHALVAGLIPAGPYSAPNIHQSPAGWTQHVRSTSSVFGGDSTLNIMNSHAKLAAALNTGSSRCVVEIQVISLSFSIITTCLCCEQGAEVRCATCPPPHGSFLPQINLLGCVSVSRHTIHRFLNFRQGHQLQDPLKLLHELPEDLQTDAISR